MLFKMNVRPTLKEYINNPIEIKDNILYSPLLPKSIMDDQEDLIMKESANIICQNKGDVLNVGFGLGIIDGYIRNLNPNTHTIIEIHPDVCKLAKEKGFGKTATLYEGDWRRWVSYFKYNKIKFDGIYFDTINIEDNANEWYYFIKEVDNILKPGGIFSYFNHTAANNKFVGETIYNLLKEGYQYHLKLILIEDIENFANKKINNDTLTYKNYELVWLTK
jgi:type IV protein arginine methyltransferase